MASNLELFVNVLYNKTMTKPVMVLLEKVVPVAYPPTVDGIGVALV